MSVRITDRRLAKQSTEVILVLRAKDTALGVRFWTKSRSMGAPLIEVMQSKPLGWKWKDRLDLSTRTIPELYENSDDVRNTPHAGVIRTTLGELGASAVFCVQGVPTIAILSVDEYDREATVNLHAALWNQGLASLLLVISSDTVRAFSLARFPHSGENHDFDDRCLVQELNAINQALILKDIIYGAESGRLWEEHADYFRSQERIDHVLLGNLTASHQLLRDSGLSFDAAQAGSSGKWGGAASQRQAVETAALCKPWKNN